MRDSLTKFHKQVPADGPVANRVNREYCVISIHTDGAMAGKLRDIMTHRNLVNNMIIPQGCPPALTMVINLLKEVVINSCRLITTDLTTFLDGGNCMIAGTNASIGDDGDFDQPLEFE